MSCLNTSKPSQKIDDDGKQHAEEQHGDDRKVNTGGPIFDSDVAGQTAQPVQFIAKKVHDQPNHNYDDSENDDVFPGGAVHTLAKYKNVAGGRILTFKL